MKLLVIRDIVIIHSLVNELGGKFIKCVKLVPNAKRSDLFKLTNAVFGKMMENHCKRIIVNLVRGCEIGRMRRLVAVSVYLSHKIFDGKLVAIHSTKIKLNLNRTIYVSHGVFNLSKYFM